MYCMLFSLSARKVILCSRGVTHTHTYFLKMLLSETGSYYQLNYPICDKVKQFWWHKWVLKCVFVNFSQCVGRVCCPQIINKRSWCPNCAHSSLITGKCFPLVPWRHTLSSQMTALGVLFVLCQASPLKLKTPTGLERLRVYWSISTMKQSKTIVCFVGLLHYISYLLSEESSSLYQTLDYFCVTLQHCLKCVVI